MRVIARIPDVSERDVVAASRGAAAPGPRPARGQRGRGGILAGIADAWPTWPLAALAAVAIVSWVLASWNDRARLERQRGEMRVAREPAAMRELPSSTPAAGGAVIR